MKRLTYISATALAILMLCSCDSSLTPGDLTGQWTQVNIESRIDDGEPELTYEPAIWTLLDNYTYTIQDEEQTETGLWDFADRTLTLHALNEGDDTLTTCYGIVACQNDTLVCFSSTQSEYGDICEITTLVKLK